MRLIYFTSGLLIRFDNHSSGLVLSHNLSRQRRGTQDSICIVLLTERPQSRGVGVVLFSPMSLTSGTCVPAVGTSDHFVFTLLRDQVTVFTNRLVILHLSGEKDIISLSTTAHEARRETHRQSSMRNLIGEIRQLISRFFNANI